MKVRILCATIAALAAGSAGAVEINDALSISGFGSVGLTHSSYKDADFNTSPPPPDGAGRTHAWSETPMTLFGVQADAKLSDKWSATVQAVSEYNYAGNYDPSISAAYVSFQARPDLTFRAGRMVMPLYALTDFSRIRYAMPWAVPPLETYKGRLGYNGVDAIYKSNIGTTSMTLQAFTGTEPESKTANNAFANDRVVRTRFSATGLSVTLDEGPHTLRAMYAVGQIKYVAGNQDIDNVVTAYKMFGRSDLASRITGGQNGKFMSLGYAYDPGTWFLRSEVVRTPLDNPARSTVASYQDFYLTAGYRIGKFTPYAIYGKEKNLGPTSADDDIALPQIGTYINNSLAANDNSRHSFSVGTRWDFRENMDFKLQWTQVVRDGDGSSAGLRNYRQAQGVTVPSRYSLIFAGIDFVF